MVRLSATDVSASVTSAPVPSVTPYSLARNNVPIIHVIGVATLNADTASGNTKPPTCTGRPSARDPSTSAGSDASEELELSATACAGNTPRVNQPRGMRPTNVAIGYMSSANSTSSAEIAST